MAKEKQISILVDAKNKAKSTLLDVRKDLKNLGDSSKKELGVFNKSFDESIDSVKKFTDKLGFMDGAVKKTFKAVSAGAAAYAGVAIKSFLDLNDGITSVNTLYSQTAQSQQKMYRDSMEIYRKIPADFKKITGATYNTISAGADSEVASKYTKKFGYAATAGDADIDIVTTAAMGTMNAYKLEAKDLNKVLDLQFMTVKEGITTYSELASSLGTGVLASAKGAGVSLEELQGSIALITKNAIPANIATTSLNQLFNKFTDTNVIKEFKEYGVSIQDANKNTRPLIEIFKDLNAQFDKKNLSSEQRKGFLKELLGSEQAARAIAPLIGDLKEFERILGQMDNSEGAMKDAFGDKLESMKVQMKLFWNNLMANGVEQINTMMPFFNKLMEPRVKRMKLELEIEDIKEKMENTDNIYEKQNYSYILNEMQTELSSIELGPVQELRDALSESVDELMKLNPPLAKFLDTIGNFTLNFVGEEGEKNRKIAKGVGTGAVGIYGFKKIVDIAHWFNTKMPKKSGEDGKLGDVLGKSVGTMNVNANIVYVNGKTVGGIGTAVRTGVGSAVGSAIGSVAGGAIGKSLMGYVLGAGGVGALASTAQLALPAAQLALPGTVATTAATTAASAGSTTAATTAASVGAAAATIPSAAIVTGVGALVASGIALGIEKNKNNKLSKINKNPQNYSYDSIKKKFVTKEELEKSNKAKVENDRKNNVTIGPANKGKDKRVNLEETNTELKNLNKNIISLVPAKKGPATVLKNNDRESKLEELGQIRSSVDLLKNSLSKELNNISNKETLIDNQIDLLNNIKVDSPSVAANVYIDGKNIPAKTIVKTNDVERNMEIKLRRYGRF